MEKKSLQDIMVYDWKWLFYPFIFKKYLITNLMQQLFRISTVQIYDDVRFRVMRFRFVTIYKSINNCVVYRNFFDKTEHFQKLKRLTTILFISKFCSLLQYFEGNIMQCILSLPVIGLKFLLEMFFLRYSLNLLKWVTCRVN